MSKAIVPQQQEKALAPQVKTWLTLKEFLERKRNAITEVAARHLSPERIVQVALSIAGRTPKLLECTPESILTALVECSRLGLEPTGRIGGAYLVPFVNSRQIDGKWKKIPEAQLMTAYQGEIDLACRTGLCQAVEARIVYERDLFEHHEGTRPRLIHKPAKTDRGAELLVYSRALLPSGAYTFEVLYSDDIESRRNRSRAKDNGPWKTDYWPMAKKSAIRAITNRLPKSSQFYTNPLAQAYVAHQAKEEAIEFDYNEDTGLYEIPPGEIEAEPPKSATDQLAEDLERKLKVDAADARWEAEQVAKWEAGEKG